MSNSLFLHSLHKEKDSKKYKQQNNIFSDTEDNDTIECICGDVDDDGFTIQCERCYTWQHGNCVNIKPDKLPKHYSCYRCLKKNKEAQYSLKKDILQNNHEHLFLHSSAVLNKNEQKGLKRSYGNPSRDIFNNMSPSATTPTHQNSNNQQITSTFTNKHIISHSKKLINQHNNYKSIQKSKKYSIYDHSHHHAIGKADHNEVPEVKMHPYIDDDTDDDYDKLVKPFDYSLNPSSSTSSISSSSSSSSSLTITDSMKHKHSTRSSFANKFEQINRNIIKHKIVKDIMQKAHDQWMPSNNNNGSKIIPLDAALLVPSIPKVSAQPLWKSLSSSYNREGVSIPKGLFADVHIPENRFILEINGEIIVKSSYKSKLSSSYHILHTPEDKTFFYPGLDLMMDSRNYGNDSRAVRRSCYPNAIIKPIILPHNTKDITIHLGLFSTEYISKSEEICISWRWKRNSLMWELYSEWKNSTKNLVKDKNRWQQIDHILILMKQQFGDCACEDKSECFIDYLKKNYQKRIKSPILPSSSSTLIHHKPLTDSKQKQQRSLSRRRSSNSEVNAKDKIKFQQQERRKSHELSHISSSTSTIRNEVNDIIHNNNKRHKSHNIQKPMNDSIDIDNEAKNDLFFASLPTSNINVSLGISPITCTTSKIIKSSEGPMELDSPIDKISEAEEIEPSKLSARIKTEGLDIDDGNLDIKNTIKKWIPNAKLPCKKAWIRSYLATTAAKTLNSNSLPEKTFKDEFINNFFSDDDEFSVKKEKKYYDNQPHKVLNSSQPSCQNVSYDVIIEQQNTNEMLEDLVLDDSSKDDSILITSHMDHDADSQMVDTSTNITIIKPAKSKMSLQQYLSKQKNNDNQI